MFYWKIASRRRVRLLFDVEPCYLSKMYGYDQCKLYSNHASISYKYKYTIFTLMKWIMSHVAWDSFGIGKPDLYHTGQDSLFACADDAMESDLHTGLDGRIEIDQP